MGKGYLCLKCALNGLCTSAATQTQGISQINLPERLLIVRVCANVESCYNQEIMTTVYMDIPTSYIGCWSHWLESVSHI